MARAGAKEVAHRTEHDARGLRLPTRVDVHVGGRIRVRRMLLGMSQEAIADKLGLTFQQVQKYEKGVNRIGASRLFQLAAVLGVPVQYFFQDMPLTAESGQTMVEEHAAESAIMDFLRTNDGMELTKAFLRISDVRSRRAILELVRSLGGHDADEPGK